MPPRKRPAAAAALDAGGAAKRAGRLDAAVLNRYPPLPVNWRTERRSALVGGSGVTVAGDTRYSVGTPFGLVVNVSFLDEGRQVLFINRHLCTHTDESGEVRYAPPHEVNYRAMVWCLRECGAVRVVALSSAGTLLPDAVPVGSVVMPDDFLMTLPQPTTFWPDPAIATFAPDASKGQCGRMHFAPAVPDDRDWLKFRGAVQASLLPVLLGAVGEKLRLAEGQTPSSWPCYEDPVKSMEERPCVYVNTVGPRFETRAEIRSYRNAGGAVVGMTCGYEWTLCSEILLPYVLISVVDNACNGLSTHPGGVVQEYLDHKKDIAEVTTAIVRQIVSGLVASPPV